MPFAEREPFVHSGVQSDVSAWNKAGTSFGTKLWRRSHVVGWRSTSSNTRRRLRGHGKWVQLKRNWRVESRTGAVALASRWLLGCFRMTRLNPVWRNSVSCSRSSNRTGRFPASGSRKRLTMLCVTPPATSEHNSGWLDSSSIPMSCVASCVRL